MFKVIVAICSVLLLLLPTNSAASYFHESPNQQTTFPGWQEPGLWRPRWVLDREIVETNPKTGRCGLERLSASQQRYIF